ncbi:PfkB family carbohydrate kinase [Rufibacter glacialis]|uniref:Nucleoside 2-deoxyribosyltransferase n=1 Tax=Rufibacter glacialis TaxID=1259555 RepID=A0A5M8QFA2_9BACT|nr:PfkB family carbohydrate kinase [Rufibacter glacialis]KAA6434715.1 nucleoside 2-deoxyribosyltransferase [Rufibacter glacialis]GGK71841.1 hypothetical protein GCM10011405_20070 [Rufibacter glacialis]
MVLNIIGGTYFEYCIEPHWSELYGSGLRAVHALSEKGLNINYHTFIDKSTLENLEVICSALNVSLYPKVIDQTSSFTYYHPLSHPEVFPIPPEKDSPIIAVKGDNVLLFGTIEGETKVIGDRVVYDPQSPYSPSTFWKNGSSANNLIWVANEQEVRSISNSSKLSEIKRYFFVEEKASAVIIKKGSDGALIIQPDKEDVVIPSYQTDSVWPIGTGDIFSSIFASKWLMELLPIEEAANIASIATAYYANSSTLPIPADLSLNSFKSFYRTSSEPKKVYLAGPFFTMSQRWLINQFRDSLLKIGLKVFSPYHDVGVGAAEEVVHLDIEALNSCDVIVAILDGLDSGTLFEVGYGRAIGKPVVGFLESGMQESMTMLEGTNCIIEKDFSTVIYKAVWESNK